jgi:nitrite reductase/ring-hydroxylating ferredoxin subunit
MAAAGQRPVICRSRELVDRGRGVRFQVRRRGSLTPAFAVRFDGVVHAYLNRCAHRSLELDWNEGDFFDAFGEHLLCATRSALCARQRCVRGRAVQGRRAGEAGRQRGKRRRPPGTGG